MTDPYYDFRAWLGAVLDDLGRGAQARLARDAGLVSTQLSRIKNLAPKGPRDTMKVELDHYMKIVQWVREQYESRGMKMPPPPEHGVGIRVLTREPLHTERHVDEAADADFEGFTRGHYHPRTRGAIPELDLKAGAGEGATGEVVSLPIGEEAYTGHKVVDEWVLPADYVRHQLGINPSHAIIVEVLGDSMIPTFLPKDKAVVDLRHNSFAGDDGVYLISDGFSPPQIKRLVSVFGSSPREVEISSDNAAVHTKRVVQLDSINIIGRVSGRLLRL